MLQTLCWVAVLLLLACDQPRDYDSRTRPDEVDASDDGSAPDEVDASLGPMPVPAACKLTVQAAQYIGEGSCGVNFSEPAADNPIYQSLAALEGGILDSSELCSSHQLAWYKVGPGRVVACPGACDRIDRLFPGFVAAVKPLVGCDVPSDKPLCSLTEAEYASVADVSCRLPIARPDDADVAYLAASRRGANVVKNHDDCAADPLAVYPDDPSHPTQLIACEGACAMTRGLFPAFVNATWRFFDCDRAASSD